MSRRWMLISCLAVPAALAACNGNPAPTTTTTAPATPTATPPAALAAGVLGPEGKHVASVRLYKGDCAPPGSRGGCHTITLKPDGTYRNMLYDAAIDGTYTISGTTVTLEAEDPALHQRLTLSADGTRLTATDETAGVFVLEP